MSKAIEITKENVEEWKLYVKQAIKLLDLNRCLLDTYVLDFFTEDIWNNINRSWRDVLDVLSPNQLSQFLSCDKNLRQDSVWPLSLQALRAAAFTYSLPRKPIQNENAIIQYLQKHTHEIYKETAESSCSPKADDACDICKDVSVADVSCKSKCSCTKSSEENETVTNAANLKVKDHSCGKQINNCNEGFARQVPLNRMNVNNSVDSSFPLYSTTTMSWGSAASELSPEAGQHKLLQHVFRRHLKPKKQHEVARLAYIAGKVAHQACEGILVDVGSGQGHLSRFLAYGHGVKVVCLEAQNEFIKGAKKFDSQLEMAVKKMKLSKKQDLPPLPPAPRHAVCHLDVNMDPSVFKEVVINTWPELSSQRGACGLLGLHTCGNLASTLLRIFTNLPMCQALVSVGCCYMKLNENCNSIECPGYPMSEFVTSVPGCILSYEAREVACHAIEMYVDRLQLGAENLKVHCYRAALEEIIVKHWPEHRRAGLRSVNHAHKMDFAEYANAAVSRLESIKLSPEDLDSEKTKRNLSRWMQVVVYYSLRLLLAPVVESVILLDRLLFLYEKGTEGILLPTFDPLLSPRNHVLIAIKDKNKL